MSAVRQAVKRAMVRTLGEQRTNEIRDLPIAMTYRTNPLARPSRRHLLDVRDRYRGKRCFIIGNGPSLKNTDLSLLRDEYTFGLNRIYLLFDEMGFRTSFLVCVNMHVVEQFADDLMAVPVPKFVSWPGREFLPPSEDVTFLLPSHRETFSEDLLRTGMWTGGTVTFTAMQVAFFMGFQEVVLVGVDHYFSTQGEANKLVTSEGPDPNHFSPEYFGKGVKWQLPDLELSEIAYRMAHEHFTRAGRSIVDATVGGHLTVFPKRKLEDCFDVRAA